MTSFSEYVQIVSLLAPSLLTAAALGVGGAVTGTFVLLRREALLALAMPHVVALGSAIALRMAWPTLPTALIVVAAAVVVIAMTSRRGPPAWLLPSLYVAGLSVSFLVIAGSGAHVADMQNLFTGIDVAVSPKDAAIAVPVILAAALLCALLWRRWLLLAQAPAAGELAGLHPLRWNLLFLILLATVLLVGTDALGVVMTVVMLFLPAATALQWCRRVPGALVCASATGVGILAMGLVLSIEMAWPLSQSVGGTGVAVVLVSALTLYLRSQRRRRSAISVTTRTVTNQESEHVT